MKIDLSAIPLIDNHAHPFPTTRLSKGNYAQRFNFSLNPQNEEILKSTMFFNMFVKQYSEFMGMPSDTTIEQLLMKAIAWSQRTAKLHR